MDLKWILARAHEHLLNLRRGLPDFVSWPEEGTDLMEEASKAKNLLIVFEHQIEQERDRRIAEVKRAREVSEKLFQFSKRQGFMIGRIRKARKRNEYEPNQDGTA